MALQLRNKVDKEKKDNGSKGGKYKRKRNVFGKRLARIGLFGTIIGLALAFVGCKVFFTLYQNNRQKKIDQDLVDVEKQIQEYRDQIDKTAESYKNVGELIATLPTSFDRQATSLDLDRIIILSGLTESTSITRKMTESDKLPFECSISTVKAIKVTMTVYGEVDKIESILSFINYLTDYEHENFYYVYSIDYSEDRSIYNRSTTNVVLYTFYNDIELNPVTPTDNTNNNTTTKTNTTTATTA